MKIKKIIIVGGGSAGWMTAATLIHSFPEKNISVIESKNVPIVGVGESTLGFIKRWTNYIGLEEKDFFKHTDASYKMSIKFTDFYKKNSGSFHYPFGNPLSINNQNPFYDWHLKKYFYPETSINDFVECLFPSYTLFKQNKFSENNFLYFNNFNVKKDVAYHFDAVKFGNWLRERYCIPRGVNHVVGTVTDIETNEEGIECLTLDNNEKITADLYIDCTGFKSLLLGDALKEPFDSFEEILPNNRAWATRIPYKDKTIELEPFTNSTAIENGWCWNIPLWSRLGAGYVYSDKFIDPEEAKEQFKQYLMSEKMVVPRTKEEVEELEYRDIKMRVGIHKKTFVKNVVAIGLSAGFIEPLESNGLFSVHEFLFKLIDILSKEEINQFDKEMYNSSVRVLFDGFAKFVSLHYVLSVREDTLYWKKNKNKKFKECEDELFSNFISKSSSYYDMAWRYLENWEHPLGDGGIPYISTGMHYFMANKSRISAQEFSNNKDLKKYTDNNIDVWNFRKQIWNDASNKEVTLYEYLKNKFYTEN